MASWDSSHEEKGCLPNLCPIDLEWALLPVSALSTHLHAHTSKVDLWQESGCIKCGMVMPRSWTAGLMFQIRIRCASTNTLRWNGLPFWPHNVF